MIVVDVLLLLLLLLLVVVVVVVVFVVVCGDWPLPTTETIVKLCYLVSIVGGRWTKKAGGLGNLC